MAMSDPIADMLTRVRNAGKAKFNSVDIPGSKMKFELAKLLKDEGYIRNYKFIKDNKQGVLRVYLKYNDKQEHSILSIDRVSKPSKRVYMKGKDIKPVYSGLGIAVLSTSKGIMTDKHAREKNIGGEIICNVW
ncbi:MAG: 30S ribosomal protein S8 [Deltaproteobacteria bacterium]|nr:MAG: 30S ribosomal protein S8 [Deltaproteobacteria bacterium]RLC14589.1 MAG: 30S ribosomal protein S8 [Deltaproteobacteria bacterium]HHE75151.1 30S ribosomal protein S8 [Desulfobacteraceae bacterium]